MTTIACDGHWMAADGLSRDAGGLICSTTIRKVRRLKDGRIFGMAGTPFDIDKLEIWLNEGGDFPSVDEDNFDCLLLDLDGRVWCYNERGNRSEEMLPAAVGSGTDLAVGAMEHGATPKEAVEIACKRHSESGGTIICLALKQ